MDFTPFLPFLDNAGASVLFLIFLILWHKRTMARDKDNQETIRQLLLALMDCTKNSIVKTAPPN